MEPREATEIILKMKREMEEDLRERICLFYRQTGLQLKDIDLFYNTAMGKQDELVLVSTRLKI